MKQHDLSKLVDVLNDALKAFKVGGVGAGDAVNNAAKKHGLELTRAEYEKAAMAVLRAAW